MCFCDFAQCIIIILQRIKYVNTALPNDRYLREWLHLCFTLPRHILNRKNTPVSLVVKHCLRIRSAAIREYCGNTAQWELRASVDLLPHYAVLPCFITTGSPQVVKAACRQKEASRCALPGIAGVTEAAAVLSGSAAGRVAA